MGSSDAGKTKTKSDNLKLINTHTHTHTHRLYVCPYLAVCGGGVREVGHEVGELLQRAEAVLWERREKYDLINNN